MAVWRSVRAPLDTVALLLRTEVHVKSFFFSASETSGGDALHLSILRFAIKSSISVVVGEFSPNVDILFQYFAS